MLGPFNSVRLVYYMLSSFAPGMKVVQLEYEAYTAMAMKQMVQICHSVREKWPVYKIAILHRTGYAIFIMFAVFTTILLHEGDIFGTTVLSGENR